jgi:hypothetical protein
MESRRVDGNTLISREMPEVQITVGAELPYIGRTRFIVKNVALAETFLFADASNGTIRRLFWVQFEGFLPGNDLTCEDPSGRTVVLGEHEYRTDLGGGVMETWIQEQPDSDVAHLVHFLSEHGYTMPAEVLLHRFVRLLDDPARNEILFVYLEDLQELGFTFADLNEGGAREAELDEVSERLYQRALSTFPVISGCR